jgi:hypothetical protein
VRELVFTAARRSLRFTTTTREDDWSDDHKRGYRVDRQLVFQ